jgi:hypothetical protein
MIKQFLGNNNKGWFGWLIVFNATFNNISVISWQSVLLVEETGVPGENHRLVALEGSLQILCFLCRSEIQDGRHRNT